MGDADRGLLLRSLRGEFEHTVVAVIDDVDVACGIHCHVVACGYCSVALQPVPTAATTNRASAAARRSGTTAVLHTALAVGQRRVERDAETQRYGLAPRQLLNVCEAAEVIRACGGAISEAMQKGCCAGLGEFSWWAGVTAETT